MQTTTEQNQIAETIFSQINTADFFARMRWGVKKSYNNKGELWLSIPRIGRRAHKVIISLDPITDTYTVKAGYLKNRIDWTETANVEGVYCDNLVPVIDGILER